MKERNSNRLITPNGKGFVWNISVMRLLALSVSLLVFSSLVAAQGEKRVNISPANSSNASPQDFEKIAADANAAREGDRVEEAIVLYEKAVKIRPQWAEGWWYLATLYYDQNKYEEGARAFTEASKLQPKSGAVWAMLGLCEFQIGKYDEAYNHIQQGRELGLGDNVELTRVMRFHEGILSMLKGEFEKAQQTLDSLCYEGLSSENLIIALGLAVLRIGMLPHQVDVKYRDREVIRRAGLSAYFAAQRNLSDSTRNYEQLVKDFPTYPNVQYAYGRFLALNRDNDGALAAFQRELISSPKHALARIQIGNLYLLNKEAAKGIPYVEEAIKLHPRLPLGHYILGRLLFDAGQNARAIQELELAAQMVPDAKIYFALTRAYTKANRKADADKAREMFTRLSKQADDAAARGNVRGNALPDETPENKPQP